MRENRERPFETYEEYGGFKQSDKVEAVTAEGVHFTGEVKSFTHYKDTDQVVANITPGQGDFERNRSKGVFGISGDQHVDAKTLKLRFRIGKKESPRFKLGKIQKH